MVKEALGNNTGRGHPHGSVLSTGGPKSQAEGWQGGLPGEGGTRLALKSEQWGKACMRSLTALVVVLRRPVGKTPSLHQEVGSM